jgi:hypothetical protein
MAIADGLEMSQHVTPGYHFHDYTRENFSHISKGVRARLQTERQRQERTVDVTTWNVDYDRATGEVLHKFEPLIFGARYRFAYKLAHARC